MESSSPTYAVRRSWILSVFLMVPGLLAFGVWDLAFNDAQLRPLFSLDALFLPLYLLFFELPHIIASFVGFLDASYLRHYRWHLFVYLPLLLLGVGLILWWQFWIGVTLYLVATMYHVIRQQTGIAHMFGIPKGLAHQVWTWTLLIGSVAMLAWVAQPFAIPEYVDTAIILGTAGVIIVSALAGVVLLRGVSSWSGIAYVCSTMAMAVSSFLLHLLGYPFLAFFCIRFVHDVTAFLFYIVHEMNRNALRVHNLLYRFLPFVPVTLVVFTPVFAIGLGLGMREVVTDTQQIFTIIMLLGFAHYYLESIMWKREAIHRQQVRVV